MVQAAGIRLDLNGPRPVAPRYSLLNTPGVVVEDDGRWLNGVVIDGYPETTPALWEPCLEGTFRTKDEGEPGPMPTFDAFVIYIAATCSTFGASTMEDKAESVLLATQSMGVEEGLAVGVSGSSNPYFADTNLTVLGGAAVAAQTGLSYLENAIGATGRGGMIHAPPSVIAAWSPYLTYESGPLLTYNGTPVVSGDGYININPDGAPGAPGAGEDYAFATGPVEVRMSDVFTSELRESLERDTNVVTIRSERYVLATWDTALQVAVLVDWSP